MTHHRRIESCQKESNLHFLNGNNGSQNPEISIRHILGWSILDGLDQVTCDLKSGVGSKISLGLFSGKAHAPTWSSSLGVLAKGTSIVPSQTNEDGSTVLFLDELREGGTDSSVISHVVVVVDENGLNQKDVCLFDGCWI